MAVAMGTTITTGTAIGTMAITTTTARTIIITGGIIRSGRTSASVSGPRGAMDTAIIITGAGTGKRTLWTHSVRKPHGVV